MRFEFATSTRILFGTETIHDLAPNAVTMGKHCLLVLGKHVPVATLVDELTAHGLAVTRFCVSGEPSVATALDGVRAAHGANCDLVIACGGGSVLDTGKAIAALVTNPGDLLDYLEVVGKGKPLAHAPAPFIAIPTTAGTGSEVTRNAVLSVPEKHVKVSLRSPLMLPRLAIVDPELTYSVPPDITASTGLDALTQLIEPYVCHTPNPITDAICIEGISRAARALPRAYHAGRDAVAREEMALASLFGGIALANAKLGAVHGFAGVLGGTLGVPHGAICARLLPFVMQTNLAALSARAPGSPTLARYARVAQLLTGNAKACAEDGVAWVHQLCAELKIPPLANWSLDESQFDAVLAQARNASSMKGNPIMLTDDELRTILQQAI
jgi:alcohol dehydrogenase class IV